MSGGGQTPRWCVHYTLPGLKRKLGCVVGSMILGPIANEIYLVWPQPLAPASALALSYSLTQFWPGYDGSDRLDSLQAGEDVVSKYKS